MYFATALFFFAAVPGGAQTAGTASVQGIVTDPSGAFVPGAKVPLTDIETGTGRDTITDQAGLYSLPNVRVGALRTYGRGIRLRRLHAARHA